MRPRTGNAAHQHGRVDLEDVKADRPDNEWRDRAGDEADDEDLQRDRTCKLRQQAGTGVDADDGDKYHQSQIFQDVARGIRRVAEETQARNDRGNDHAGKPKAGN